MFNKGKIASEGTEEGRVLLPKSIQHTFDYETEKGTDTLNLFPPLRVFLKRIVEVEK